MCIKSFIGHPITKLRNQISDSHGQVVAFFGLVIPLLFMSVCVGFDLGWYYLNVSRLQNAADDTDINAGNAVAKLYADKNLSNGDGDDLTDSWTKGTVTDIESLYKDDDGNFLSGRRESF